MKKTFGNIVVIIIFLSQNYFLAAQVYVRDSSDVAAPGAVLIKNEAALNFIVIQAIDYTGKIIYKL